jgi:hypothetical protein
MESPSLVVQVSIFCHHSGDCLSCPPRLSSTRYDRLSWRWFQRGKDPRSGTKQAAGWRTPHGTLPYYSFSILEETFTRLKASACPDAPAHFR